MSTDPVANAAPWLVLMKGLPGTGKSAVARELGRQLRWPVIDKDDVRDLLPDRLGGLSYEAMLAIAGRQLELGLSVIADSPLGYARSYRKALEIADRCRASVVVVETICSDRSEWLNRIERRAGTGLAAHHTTQWAGVEDFLARSSADPFTVDRAHIVIDTSGKEPATLTQAIVMRFESAGPLETEERLGARDIPTHLER